MTMSHCLPYTNPQDTLQPKVMMPTIGWNASNSFFGGLYTENLEAIGSYLSILLETCDHNEKYKDKDGWPSFKAGELDKAGLCAGCKEMDKLAKIYRHMRIGETMKL